MCLVTTTTITTTEIPLIDDDTQRVDAFSKNERLPLPTTQLFSSPSSTETRFVLNSTVRPSNQTLNEKPSIEPDSKFKTARDKQFLTGSTNKHVSTLLHSFHAPLLQPIRVMTDNGNKTNPIHVKAKIDPELTELRRRIAAGNFYKTPHFNLFIQE